MNCAAVPCARPQAPFQIHTRSPMRFGSTPSPTASTTPMPSLCGTMRGKGSCLLRRPARLFTSDGLTPDQRSRTRTSPGPGCGSGSSATVSTSAAGPVRS